MIRTAASTATKSNWSQSLFNSSTQRSHMQAESTHQACHARGRVHAVVQVGRDGASARACRVEHPRPAHPTPHMQRGDTTNSTSLGRLLYKVDGWDWAERSGHHRLWSLQTCQDDREVGRAGSPSTTISRTLFEPNNGFVARTSEWCTLLL